MPRLGGKPEKLGNLYEGWAGGLRTVPFGVRRSHVTWRA